MYERLNLGSLELAPRHAVEAFWPEVERVLDALGYPGALVTDESIVADFGLSDAAVRGAAFRLRIPIAQDDHLYALAFRLRVKDHR